MRNTARPSNQDSLVLGRVRHFPLKRIKSAFDQFTDRHTMGDFSTLITFPFGIQDLMDAFVPTLRDARVERHDILAADDS